MLEGFIAIHGYKTRYIAMGSGKPVVLVHGLGSSVETWKKNMNQLAKHFKVYAFDLLGFGMAEKPRISYRIGVFSEFLKGFLDVLGVEMASLVGNSLGGLVSLWFSLSDQERIEKLVIESSAGLEKGARYVIKGFMGEKWTLKRLKEFYEFIYFKPHVDEKLLELRVKPLSKPDAEHVFESTLNMPREWEDLPERLKRLERPTLIVWGAEDRLISVKHAYEFHQLINGSKLVVFERTGHVPHAERPEKFNKVVANFLLQN